MARIRFKTVTGCSGLLMLVGVVGLGFYYSRLQWIPAGHVGVIYDARRGLLDEVIPPKAVFVGWRQRLYTYPTKLQAAVYTQDETAGEVRAADGIQVTTNDNANTVFDVAVMYRVKPEDVVRVFNAYGPVSIEDIQTTQIRRAVKEAANDVGTQYDLFTLMGPKRKEASQKLADSLRARVAHNGITIETAMLGGCYPSQDFQSKITSRVNAYIELEISKLRRQIAEIDRQVAVLRGQAEAQARTISAAQTQDRSISMLQLDATGDAIEKWNGALPPIQPGPGQTVVVTPDVLSAIAGGHK